MQRLVPAAQLPATISRYPQLHEACLQRFANELDLPAPNNGDPRGVDADLFANSERDEILVTNL